MRIVVVSTFYSAGMGYTENCLPKALAALGHDVHVVTSNFNVYGTSSDYDVTYRAFLGPADQGQGRFQVDGYTVHRLASRMLGGYVMLKGLAGCVRALDPDIVHSTEIASLQTFELAALRPFSRFKLFAETHQHMSVVKPFLKQPRGHVIRKALYALTRKLPTSLASASVEKCYAIAPDCVQVAEQFYGVPHRKMKLQSLGTDTHLFRPAATDEEMEQRARLRQEHGYGSDDVVCIYTGRFSADKNPLLLAQAIGLLSAEEPRFRGLFVGEGPQKAQIAQVPLCKIVPFSKHTLLAELYRIADIAVWPRQESMSMLDAAASGLPLIVSNTIGESERVAGNGAMYMENDAADLARCLRKLAVRDTRRLLGEHGRRKMVDHFSWTSIARAIVADYDAAAQRLPVRS